MDSSLSLYRQQWTALCLCTDNNVQLSVSVQTTMDSSLSLYRQQWTALCLCTDNNGQLSVSVQTTMDSSLSLYRQQWTALCLCTDNNQHDDCGLSLQTLSMTIRKHTGAFACPQTHYTISMPTSTPTSTPTARAHYYLCICNSRFPHTSIDL